MEYANFLTFAEPEILELESSPEKSVVQVLLNGVNKWVINHGCDTTYEVVCQTGTMIVGTEIYELRPGVVVSVPKGTPYQDYGDNLRMIATSVPAFDPQKVEYID